MTSSTMAGRNRRRVRPVTDAVAPASLGVLVFAGALKVNPVLRWLPIDLTLLAAAVVVFGCLVSLGADGRTRGMIAVPFVLWCLFLFGVFNAPLVGYSATKVLTLFSVTLVIVLAPFFVLRRRRQVRAFLGTVVAIGALTATMAILEPAVYSDRLVTEGANTIATGQITGAASIVLFVVVITGRSHIGARLAGLIGALVLLLATFATGSRGPAIGAGIALLCVLLLAPVLKKYRGRAIVLAGILLLVALPWALSNSNAGVIRILGFLSGERDSSTEHRELMWAQSVQQILENPWGSGWGSFSGFGIHQYPHNLILEVWVEAGWIVGLALIAYLIVSLVRARNNATSLEGTAMLALLVFSISNAMVSSDINGDRLMWAMLSVAWVSWTTTKESGAHLDKASAARGNPAGGRLG